MKSFSLPKIRIMWLLITIFISLVSGCTVSPQRVTDPNSENLNPLNANQLRLWDEHYTATYDVAREINTMLSHKTGDDEINHLALSGGGVNGAYAAGVLNAWSIKGERPEFDIVTGVSTGAIVAIFAYLGSNYDNDLAEYYNDLPIEDLFKKNSLITALSSGTLVNIEGFEKQVQKSINTELVASLAKVRETGRILLIGTTNLDNEKLAIWDIGKIAQLGTPESVSLIQDIIIASTAIPGAFPAKEITIRTSDEEYSELHVDGGVSRQVFLVPSSVRNNITQSKLKHNIYIIRNGRMEPEYKVTNNSFSHISSRSLAIILRHQGIGDIEHIFHYSQENKINFNLSFIDSRFEWNNKKIYSQAYMNSLYEFGYRKLTSDQGWVDIPPSLDSK